MNRITPVYYLNSSLMLNEGHYSQQASFGTLTCAENVISINDLVDTTNLDTTRGSSFLHNFSCLLIWSQLMKITEVK